MESLQATRNVTATGATTYGGPWERTQVNHLLRRALFGVRKEDILAFEKLSLQAAVDKLLNYSTTLPSPPVNNYNTSTNIDPNVPAGQTWVTGKNDGGLNGQRRNSWRSWWSGLMINQDTNIREKMTLFWQNHFGTEANVVGQAIMVYNHNTLLRKMATGNFKEMVKQVTIDPAMLKYLNGEQNQKTSPDENYAREIQELFCIGKGPGSGYTEADVKAAAKVLTGYQVNYSLNSYSFNPTRHDTGDKQFSAFYNNTVIKGKTGAAGQEELDDLLNMIFATNEVAKFIVRKLYVFFVYYEITPEVEANFITPLADLFRKNNYEIKPLLKAFFTSEHFYDPVNMGCMIKPPVDFNVGMFRQFGIPQPNASDFVNLYRTWQVVYSQNATMQQGLGDPPNVAGYPAYYQEPIFHQAWINSTTLTARNTFSTRMFSNGYTYGGVKVAIDPTLFVSKLDKPEDPNALIDETIFLLFGLDLTPATKEFLKKDILLSGQDSDYYWTEIWEAYANNPTNATTKNLVANRLKPLFDYFINMAEYQIS